MTLNPLQQAAPLLHRVSTQRLRVLGISLFALASIFIAVTPARAQQVNPGNEARISKIVDNTILTTLKGNTHPLARTKNDRGPVNASLPANRMQLVLKRSDSQERSLRQFLGSVQDKNSPQYRKWITPAQFGAQYGASVADIQTISTWLASEGFKVNGVNKAHTVVEFSGSVGQVQTAFHTQFHTFAVNGVEHIANVTDPMIPSALAPVVAGLSSLNSFFPRPQHTTPQPARYDSATHKATPLLTTGSASTGYSLYVGPGDAATIYDTPNTLNTNFASGTSYTGTGVSIGVAGDSNVATSDVANYRNIFGLPVNTPTVIVDGNDPGINGDQVEALLDLELAGGLAPAANVTLYTAANTNLSSGLYLAINRALDDNAVDILNVSFGGCEAFQGSSGNQFINSLWEQAASQGITVTVSTGDSGAAGCDNDNTETQAQSGLQVNGLASTPFNIAVGGTDYNVLGSNFTQYVGTGNTTTTAKGYIPEEPWNNSPQTNGLLSANTPFTDSNGNTNIVGAGGGASSCILPQTDASGNVIGCSLTSDNVTGWTKPSWQIGSNLNIPNDSVRDLPDVSLLAANGDYSATWLVCADVADANGNVTTPTCQPDSTGAYSFYGVGGTSASSPAFAGIVALISQSQGNARLGQANYVLYNLANQSNLYSSLFHDTTIGNNSVYCVAGSGDCGTNSFLLGYDTGTAYDQASGLGSVDASKLIASWGSAVFTPSTTSFTINGGTAPVSITHGQSVTLSASVAGASGTPSGDVAILGNVNESNATVNSDWIGTYTLASGTTGSQTYANLPGGTYTVYANYGGDINYAQSQSTPGIQVTVAKEGSVLNLFPVNGSGNQTTIPASVPYGTYFSLDAQPVGASQTTSTTPAFATGNVVFADTAGAFAGGVSGTVAISSFGSAELPVYYWPVAAHSVSASYAGDNSFTASTATPVVFAVVAAPTASTVSASTTSVGGSGTFTVSSVITPTPASGANYPTGTVTLTVNGTSIGSGAVVAAQDQTTGASLATVTITVNASALATGANTITATYSGDADYATSSGTVSVTSTGGTGGGGSFAVTTTAVSVTAGASTGNTSTITVTPSGGFTGAVSLTAAVTTSPAGAIDTPTVALSAASVTISGTTAATATATISTTASTTSALTYPQTNQPHSKSWYEAAGGAALACVLFFGIPARRRSWKAILGLLVFLVTMAGVGCGGGSSHKTIPGTTAGSYVITVTATDAAGTKSTGTINLTVN